MGKVKKTHKSVKQIKSIPKKTKSSNILGEHHPQRFESLIKCLHCKHYIPELNFCGICGNFLFNTSEHCLGATKFRIVPFDIDHAKAPNYYKKRRDDYSHNRQCCSSSTTTDVSERYSYYSSKMPYNSPNSTQTVDTERFFLEEFSMETLTTDLDVPEEMLGHLDSRSNS